MPVDERGKPGRGLFHVLLGGGSQLVVGLLQGEIVGLTNPVVRGSEEAAGHLCFPRHDEPTGGEPLGQGIGVRRLEGVQEIIEQPVHHVADKPRACPFQDSEGSLDRETSETSLILDLRLEDAHGVVDDPRPLVPRLQLRS